MKTNQVGLRALTTSKERAELRVVRLVSRSVKLKRTFNQSNFKGGYIKYWRVISPVTHPRYHSDLSIEGLQEAGII